MPRRKQDKPKKMKWEDGGEMASKDEEMALSSEGPSLVTNDTDRSNDGFAAPSPTPPTPSPKTTSPHPPSTPSPSTLPPALAVSNKHGDVVDKDNEDSDYPNRRMVAAEEEEEEPVGAAPISSPPPLPPPAIAVPISPVPPNRLTPSPMVVHKAIPEELLLQRPIHVGSEMLAAMERHSPSPLRVSNPISPKDLSSPGPCASPSAASDEAPLDFSMKSKSSTRTSVSSRESDSSPAPHAEGLTGDSPLDLSVPRRRKEGAIDPHGRPTKVSKLDCPSPAASVKQAPNPWNYAPPKTGYPPGLNPKSESQSMNAPLSSSWNGVKVSKGHHRSSGSSKSFSGHHSVFGPTRNNQSASSSRGHGASSVAQLAQAAANAGLSPAERGSSSSKPGRQNPWQTQWMSKSSEQSKAVFTCVFCQEPCMSLAEMTLHMKKSPNCGKAAGIQAAIPSCLPRSPVPSAGSSQSTPTAHSSGASVSHASGSVSAKTQSSSMASSSSGGGASGNSQQQHQQHQQQQQQQGVKESMPLPRKLVRGQDVWLGKGAEQTRQILKCMWCGQSFKTLADMTTHMRVTQHYTNIISQEQIISWRTPEDKVAAQSQVNAVLTCKVCDQAFGSLKELSYHMVKNSHYKEHILRSISEGGGRRRQTRERRKKSLPVRKLLELERMEMNKQQGASGSGASQNHAVPADLTNASGGQVSSRSSHGSSAAALAGVKVEPAVDGKITCEECAEKVDAKDFVRHIKKCSGQRNHQANLLASAAAKVKTEPPDESATPLNVTTSSLAGAPKSSSPDSKKTPPSKALLKDGRRTASPGGGGGGDDSKADKGATDNSCDSAESTSVLNAIERLIEKSFEHKGRRGVANTGILQRLGIDEEVYPPWHPASSPGKMTPSSDGGRAKSTSPLRINIGDPQDSVMSGRGIYEDRKHHSHHHYDNFNHANMAGCGSETSRGSTPVSLMNTLSPARSLTMSPHRTHSSMTGSTSGGSPPPSPHSGPPLSPSPSVSSVTQQAPKAENQASQSTTFKEETAEQSTRSPKSTTRGSTEHANDQETDIEDEEAAGETADLSPVRAIRSPSKSVNSSPPPAATASAIAAAAASQIAKAPERPSRSSSVSSFEDMTRNRTSPVSESDASLRPASSAEEQPLELVKSSVGSSKRKKSSRHHHHHRKSYQSSNASRKKKNADSGAAASSTEQLGADHPLRELQKLLDKTDAHLSRPPAAIQHNSAGPGSILAFSWACNDVAASSDSLMKCAFCETHFISKGAYRHHLSKMHFVKEAGSSGTNATSTSGGSSAAASSAATDGGSGNHDRSRNGTDSKEGQVNSTTNASQPLPSSISDESTHSKFLKYTELAKQLSSKYV